MVSEETHTLTGDLLWSDNALTGMADAHEPPGTPHQTETEVIVGKPPDHPLRLEFTQTLYGKYEVDVPKRICSVIGLGRPVIIGNEPPQRLDSGR